MSNSRFGFRSRKGEIRSFIEGNIATPTAILDTYPNAAGAYSIRRLSTSYLGSAIRVRRTADNVESNIGFTNSGDLDEAALIAFIGVNSARVVTWYDQSGNGRDVTQSVAGNQPIIMSSGVIRKIGGKPSIHFESVGQILTRVNTFTVTHSTQVCRVNSVNTINYSFGFGNSGFYWHGTFFGGSAGLGAFDGSVTATRAGADLNRHLGWFSMRSSRLFVARDGSAETDAGAFSNSLSINLVGGREFSGGYFLGDIQEIISWDV